MLREGAQWKVVRAARWAASANRIYGRSVTSFKTWTWLNSPAFRATPLDMMGEADIHFLQGINQLIGHGWGYTPPYVEYPGWRFYAAGAYSEQYPWWIVMPDLAAYLQRMSYIMRQGTPQNDGALYMPTADAYAHFSAGRVHLIEPDRELVGEQVMPAIFVAGYNIDFFDDEVLRTVGSSEKGTLSLGASKAAICRAMKELDTYPDFITIDGAEGGTGAAPLEFTNSLGMPWVDGLTIARDLLDHFDIKKHVRLVTSGKVVTGFHLMKALALGADAVNSARGMMLALGCIHARRCNTNHCPAGVATNHPNLTVGLVVEDKRQRVTNFHENTIRAFAEILGACGLEGPHQLSRRHILRRGETGAVHGRPTKLNRKRRKASEDPISSASGFWWVVTTTFLGSVNRGKNCSSGFIKRLRR